MSCLSFGELNIPSSRAFWDDCDEDEPIEQAAEKLQLKYEVDQSKDTVISTELLLLIEGVSILEFTEQTLLQKATKICAIPSRKSSLYALKGTKVLLAVLEEDLSSSGEITELLLPYAKQAQKVVTITVKSKVDYKSEHIARVRDEITFLRGINSELKHINELKTPNFIAGVAAGIASWRDNEKLPVQSYVAYTDNVALDALAAQPILKLLHDHLGIDCSTTFTPKLKDDSHLYM